MEYIIAEKCPECGCIKILQLARDKRVCANCGLVLNLYKNKEFLERGKCQKSQNIESIGRTTSTKKREGRSEANIALDEVMAEALLGLLRISDSTEKNIALTLISIVKIMSKVGMQQDILKEALEIYRNLAVKCTFKGKSINALSAAIVYMASKKAVSGCGLKEVARAANLSPRAVFRCYRFISENLEHTAPNVSISNYILRICKRLSLRSQVVNVANEISIATKEHLRVKGSLSGIAAASIYISSIINGERKTQREIADTIGITEATIRAKYKEIIRKLQIITIV